MIARRLSLLEDAAPADPFAALGAVFERFTLIDAEGLTDGQAVPSVTGLLDTVRQTVASQQPLYEDPPGSLLFDGVDDYLQTATKNTAYNPIHSQAGVIGVSFRYAAYPFSGAERLWSTAAGASNPGTYLILLGSSSYLFGIAGSGYPIRINVASGITDTAWHTLIAEHDGTDATVYIDGVLSSTQAFRAVYDTGDCEELTLGATPNGSDNFTGQIGDWIAYTGAVDAAALHSLLIGRVS